MVHARRTRDPPGESTGPRSRSTPGRRNRSPTFLIDGAVAGRLARRAHEGEGDAAARAVRAAAARRARRGDAPRPSGSSAGTRPMPRATQLGSRDETGARVPLARGGPMAVVAVGCGGGGGDQRLSKADYDEKEVGAIDAGLFDALRAVGTATTVKAHPRRARTVPGRVRAPRGRARRHRHPPKDVEVEREELASGVREFPGQLNPIIARVAQGQPAGDRRRPVHAGDDEDDPGHGRVSATRATSSATEARSVPAAAGDRTYRRALTLRLGRVQIGGPRRERVSRGRRRAASTRAGRRRAGAAPCRGRRTGCGGSRCATAISAR